MNKVLKVLAVGDPAVYGYTHEDYKIISGFKGDFSVDFNIVPWNDYYGDMIENLEGKGNYDVVMIAGHLWLKDFVNKGYLSTVSCKEDKDYEYEDIIPVIRKEIEINGVPYLYPSFCDGHIVLYRKSVVQKVIGKQPETSITTDELIDMVKKVHGFEGMHGIALKAHPSEIFLDFLPYLRNEGIDAVEKETHVPIFNNEKGLLALRKYLSLKEFASDNTNTYGNEEVKEAFQKKKTVFAVTWGGQLGTVLNENCEDIEDIGFAALKTSWNVTWSFGINSNSKYKEEANIFLKYLTSKKIDRIIGGYSGSPVRKSSYIQDSEKYNWYNIHLELIEKYAKPLPKILKAGDKFGVLYDVISKTFSGELSPEEALKQGEERFLEI